MRMNLNEIGVTLIATASLFSLLLVVGKPLAREFESTALVWIRAFRRIRAEWAKPIGAPSQPHRTLTDTGSKRELDSAYRKNGR